MLRPYKCAVGAVYVDNMTVVGRGCEGAADGYRNVKQELEAVGFILHEEEDSAV